MIVELMSQGLGIPEHRILGVSHAASHSYKKYEISKRGGGKRTIHHPARPLKALQRWLLHEVVAKWPVHSAAMAYRSGLSILDNAEVHRGSSFLLRMDLNDFFPSITSQDFQRYVTAQSVIFASWKSDDVDLFCDLVFRNGCLTIGAPTSPSLANALCYDLDVQLSGLSSTLQVKYTRYADDLFFSTERPDVLGSIEQSVCEIVAGLTNPKNLSINSAKTRHSSKKGARRVTGIVLGSDGNIYIGRDLKRRIRAMIHKFGDLSAGDRATLRGLLAYAVGFDPDFKNSLIDKYGLGRVNEVIMFKKIALPKQSS